MDGADSEHLISEPEALEELPSLAVHLSPLNVTDQDGLIITGHTPGDRNETLEPSMDSQLGNPQNMVQHVDGAP